MDGFTCVWTSIKKLGSQFVIIVIYDDNLDLIKTYEDFSNAMHYLEK